MWPAHLFAEHRTEYLWEDRCWDEPTLVRTDSGCAEGKQLRITARSGLEPLRTSAPDLAEILDTPHPIPRLPELDASVRSLRITRSQRVVVSEQGTELVDESWAQVSSEVEQRIVIPEHLSAVRLAGLDQPGTVAIDSPAEQALRFVEGTAALIFHELAGHGSLNETSRLARSVRVVDEPRALDGTERALDDAGQPARARSLLDTGTAQFRRASFLDTPIPRMFSLTVEPLESGSTDARDAVVITRISEGRYDERRASGSWRVAESHSLLDGELRALSPWWLTLTNAELERRLVAVSGEPRSHPPILCSDQGQRLPVLHAGPDMLLAPR